MEKVTRRIFAYKINTPITNTEEDQMYDKVYYKDIFESFLSKIQDQDQRVKALTEEGKYLDINDYAISDFDNNYIEGVMHTTRYGTLNDIIEIESQEVQGKVLPNQGVKYDVHFVLCRQSGLLLVESDPYRVATRNTIDHYLSKKQALMHGYIRKFNRENNPNFIYDTILFTIENVLDDNFYSQLSRINKVKEVSGYMNIDDFGHNAALDHFIEEESEEYTEDESISQISEFRVSLINRVRNSGLSHVERFIRNIVDIEKFSRFEVSGYDNNNQKRSATFNVKPVDFYVEADQSSDGILNSNQLFQEMIEVAKNENPFIKVDSNEDQNSEDKGQ